MIDAYFAAEGIMTSLCREFRYDSRENESRLCQNVVLRCYETAISTIPRPCLAVLQQHPQRVWDNQSVISRRLAPNFIDYGIFRNLIQLCAEKHTTCRQDTCQDNVSRLRVIDIRRRKVVLAPRRCCYFALSYVWGTSTFQQGLACPPLVIEDAISVTLALGCKYLWVDRYCIDQKSAEKHSMIRQMDRIYANASVTIVAAVGNNADAGLPGVSKTHRPRQPEFRVPGTETVLLSIPDGELGLKNSTWAKRGWTYQEGYFSKRRLIFTDDQVLFMCNEVYLPESIRYPMGTAFSALRIPHHLCDLLPDYGESSYRGRPAGKISNEITEYCKRQLSYPSDALTAFLGVFNHHTSNFLGFTYFRGIPVLTRGKYPQLWLLWTHASPAKRRDGFPSWSWAGWEGMVEWGAGDVNLSDPSCAMFVEQEGGRAKTSLVVFVEGRLAGLSPWYEPRRLWISGLTVPLEMRKVEPAERFPQRAITLQLSSAAIRISRNWSGWSGDAVVLPMCQNVTVGGKAYFDQSIEPGENACCLLLCRHVSEHLAYFPFLVVRQINEEAWERVGVVTIVLSELSYNGLRVLDWPDDLVPDDILHLEAWSFADLFREGFEEKTICVV